MPSTSPGLARLLGRARLLSCLAVVVVAGAALAAACGTSDGGGDAPGGPDAAGTPSADAAGDGAAGGTIPCAVSDVLDRRCRSCHASPTRFSAPMALARWEDFHAPSVGDLTRPVHAIVRERIASVDAPMPPVPNPRLEGDDLAILDAWLARGAPSEGPACGAPGDASTPPIVTTSCDDFTDVAPAAPFELPAAPGDAYVCYGVDLAPTSAKHVVAIAPRVDNAQVVHHVVVYQSDATVSSTPTPCDPGGSLRWRMVYGWAPGGRALELPPQAGFALPADATTHYVVQLHYNNATGAEAQRDATGVKLCLEPPRAQEADVLAFGTQAITIPPQSDHAVTCRIEVPAFFPTMNVVAAMPHMHEIGTRMSTVLKPRAGGPEVDLGTVASFSFANQPWLPVGAQVKPGDTVETRCAWRNPAPREVRFGERTEDEMCYSFTVYYPKVRAPQWSWAAPALGSTCD